MTESYHIEFKQKWKDEYLQYVSGFANAQGGTLFVGIDDSGNAVGVKDIDGDMLKIKDRIRLGISPSPMGLFDVTIERID